MERNKLRRLASCGTKRHCHSIVGVTGTAPLSLAPFFCPLTPLLVFLQTEEEEVLPWSSIFIVGRAIFSGMNTREAQNPSIMSHSGVSSSWRHDSGVEELRDRTLFSFIWVYCCSFILFQAIIICIDRVCVRTFFSRDRVERVVNLDLDYFL